MDNIFLMYGEFLPNLKVTDSDETEYPIMSNADVRLLLQFMQEDGKNVNDLRQQVDKGIIFLIWIKVPPNKKLKPSEVRILHVDYEKKNEGRNDMNVLDVSSNPAFPVFWIFKKPQDYDVTDRYCVTKQGDEIKWSTWRQDMSGMLRYHDTPESSVLLVRPENQKVVLAYSFSPKVSVMALPVASLILLTSFSLFLIMVQVSESLSMFKELLEHKLELALFVASSSIIIPRFINNVEIRHRIFWVYFVPVGLSIVFALLSFGRVSFN